MEGRSILTASFPEFIYELSFSSARKTGCRLSADLALEMTEDALQEASMYLRRCDLDRCATERALRRSRTADSASWDHQVLGGTTKAAKGDRGLGSFD